MEQKGKTYLFSGATLLPKDVPMRDHLVRTISMLEIDPEKEVIVRASFMAQIKHTNDFLASIAEGYDLKQGIEPLLKEMEERAHVPPIRAWIKAVEIAYQKYQEFRKDKYM